MDIQKQNEFLLSLLNRLFLELVAYRVLVDSVKSAAGGPQIEAALQRSRLDPVTRSQVDSYCQILAAGLPLAAHESADRVLSQFLGQWNGQSAQD